jgi:hypothetical protein
MSSPISPLRSILLDLLKKSATPTTDNHQQQQQQPYYNSAAITSQVPANPYYADSISSANEQQAKASTTAPINNQQHYANFAAKSSQAAANSYYIDSIASAKSLNSTTPIATITPNQATAPTVIAAKPVNVYYVDKILKAEPISHATVIPVQAAAMSTAVTPTVTASTQAPVAAPSAIPPKSRVELYYEQLSLQIDNDLNKGESNFEQLRNTIDKVIMLLLRMSAVADQERIFEITIKVKNQAHEIKGTYNKWQGTSITVISAGVSIAAAIAGLTPLLSAEIISAQIAQTLAQASMQIGTMSTGLSGFGSLFTNREEGNRTVYQVYLKKFQDQEEEKKGSKHSKSDLIKSVNNSAHENLRNWHDTVRAVLGG